jgi:hypothetical protein
VKALRRPCCAWTHAIDKFFTAAVTFSSRSRTTYDPFYDHQQRLCLQRPLFITPHSLTLPRCSNSLSLHTRFLPQCTPLKPPLNTTILPLYRASTSIRTMPRPGDAQEFISSLGTMECSICEEAFDSEHLPVMVDGCRHVFGQKCLARWVNSDNAGINKCPVC